MDQDETTPAAEVDETHAVDTEAQIFEPTPTEIAAEELEGKRGPILETLAARITIRYPVERTERDEEIAKSLDLTNDRIAEVIQVAIAEHIDTSYVGPMVDFTVNATAEKV